MLTNNIAVLDIVVKLDPKKFVRNQHFLQEIAADSDYTWEDKDTIVIHGLARFGILMGLALTGRTFQIHI